MDINTIVLSADKFSPQSIGLISEQGLLPIRGKPSISWCIDSLKQKGYHDIKWCCVKTISA